MLGKDKIMEISEKQKMERPETLKKECSEWYKVALHMAVALIVSHVCSLSQYGTFGDHD